MMDSQTKIIMGLLILIAILVGVFVLKVTGVIKPADKVKIEETQKTEETEEIKKVKESFIMKLISFITMNIIVIIIIVFIINMILSIGEAKLYRKIGMPDWTISFKYIDPIVTLIFGFMPRIISNGIESILGILSFYCLCKFFGCLGVSKWWPLAFVAGLILSIIGIFRSGINILLIMGIILLIAYLYAHIITSIRLAKEFDKGKLFTILLIIFPSIFQPVLGYQKN